MPQRNLFTMPPPIGGINLRDTETHFPQGNGVPITDALVLTNIFPGSSAADIRGGSEQYVDLSGQSGFSGGSTDTLATLIRGTNSYFVAASEGGFIDISTSSMTTLTAAATHSVDRWQWVNFLDRAGAGEELLLVNGTDTPQRFDGTTMSNWTFADETATALTEENFVGILAFKNRVYMWENDSSDFYFGVLGKIPGTGGAADGLTRFPLNAVRGIQGNIVAMEAWTRDAGDGADDYLAIILSGGVVAIYKGTDPSPSASDWAIDGVYQIPPPIDVRGVSKFLDDIVILTRNDIVFLSQVIRTQGITGNESKIAPLVKSLSAQYGTATGWGITIWPDGSRAYINVPYSATTAQQIVFNTRTLAACEYQGWNARTFGVFGNNVYFSDAAGIVWLAETGARDNDGEIVADWTTPLHTFGKPGPKRINAIRPDLSVSDCVSIAAVASVDFRTRKPTAATSIGDSTGWVWDSSPTSGPTWDDLKWSGLNDRTPQTTWKMLAGEGEKISLSLQIRVDDIACTINSMGVSWIQGQGLL